MSSGLPALELIGGGDLFLVDDVDHLLLARRVLALTAETSAIVRRWNVGGLLPSRFAAGPTADRWHAGRLVNT